MQKLTRNSFEGGRNTDVETNRIESAFYTEAHNVELVSDGSFLALKNLRGTINVQDITSVPDTEVLGVFETFYEIDGIKNVRCLTVLTAKNSGKLKIWCYDTENDNLYEVYEKDVDSDYITNDRIIDAKAYAENGIDILYFTDFFDEVRQVRCQIVFPYVANFANDSDVSLQRWGSNGKVYLANTITGSLLSGSYQFCYRMVNTSTKKYTKWSSLSNPIPIFLDTGTSAYRQAAIGLPTTTGIRLAVNIPETETNNFDQYQLAVIENIYPSSTAQTVGSNENQSFVASLLPIKSISDGYYYDYKSNTKVGTVPIDEIVVPLAPIKTVKTLGISNNKLYLGNIKYRTLELDNDNPAVTNSSIIVDTSYPYETAGAVDFGYYRDEVYRFAIVYYDKYGNASSPYVLNMSNTTDNQISGGLIDMKFPKRSLNNTYSILDAFDRPKKLGLRFTGVINHPTWAVSFEIVRAKRIKRIVCQTPVVPMTYVEGIGAYQKYPTTPRIDNPNVTQEYASAQPMSTTKVYVPKNLFIPEKRAIKKRSTTVGEATKGECEYVTDGTYEYAVIFNQQELYENSNYTPTGNEKLETIDFCLTKLNSAEYYSAADEPPTTIFSGERVDTKVSGTFYANAHKSYYFDATSSYIGKSSLYSTTNIIDYISIPQGSEGTVSTNGDKIMTYSDLETDSVPGISYTPSNQRQSVIKLKNPVIDPGGQLITFAEGTHNAFVESSYPAPYIMGSSGPQYQPKLVSGTAYNNTFVFKYPSYAESSYVQVLQIANVIKGEIGDSRYGDLDTQHEFISTGAKYTFTPSDLISVAAGAHLPINIDVWGGDCIVSHHTFKVSDGCYSIINSGKNQGAELPGDFLLRAWKKLYTNNTNTSVLTMPLGLEKVAQFVQVYLESDYNGTVMDADIISPALPVTGITSYVFNVMNVNTEGGIKTPLTYGYNINISKQNNERIYLPKPSYFVEQNNFASRFHISDQKIYNSDVQGFDVFRVLNYYDLEESKGAITKLAAGGDDLYAIQERGVTYLPLGQTQLELTDGSNLSVGTSSEVGKVIILDSNKGGQHLASIVETGDMIYIPDARNKSVYQLNNRTLKKISAINNDSLFRTLFSTEVPERYLVGGYDPIRRQYMLVNNIVDRCDIFNESSDSWTANLEFFSRLKGIRFTNRKLYFIGKVSDTISVNTMYEGNWNSFFGVDVTPRATFVVNPDPPFSKTFDNQMIVSSDRLDTIDWVVEREQLLGNQTAGTIIDEPSVEGNFRIKTLRDSVGARLRGLRMITTINWKTSNMGVAVSNVLTKFRLSSRSPF